MFTSDLKDTTHIHKKQKWFVTVTCFFNSGQQLKRESYRRYFLYHCGKKPVAQIIKLKNIFYVSY